MKDMLQLVPLLALSLMFGVQSNMLAKEKGRNVVLWTVLGSLPMVNFFCMLFFIGASDLRLESKVDELLSRLSK